MTHLHKLISLIALIALVVPSWLCAQEKLAVQVKAFDQQLKPLGNLELAVNENNYFLVGQRGVAIVDIPQNDLPPKSIKVRNDDLEAESWNYSRGILEIIIRKKSYRIVTVTLRESNGGVVADTEITFRGAYTFRGKTNSAGVVEMALPVHEKITAPSQFSVPSYVAQRIDERGDECTIYVVPAKASASVSGQEKRGSASFNNFDLRNLDSIRSLTVFYAVFKNYRMSDLGEEEKDRIDNKFRQLISQLEDSLSRPGHSFLGRISDSSFVGEDVRNLLAQAEAEEQTLDFLRTSFDEKIRVLNEKLTEKGENLDSETRRRLMNDISRLETILRQNEQKFYRNQNDYHSVLNSLKEKFFTFEDLENRLSVSEAQRVADREEFRKKILTILLVASCFAVLTALLVYFSNRLKKRKRELELANAEISRINENLEVIVSERTAMLENAHREIDIFLYKASHDLRGPICSIIGLCNIASRTVDGDALEIIQKTCNTAFAMDKMLRKLKIISEINHPSNYSLVMLDEHFRTVKHEFRKFIRDNNISLSVRCPAAITFHSYPNLIDVILMSLVENALYFSTIENSDRPKVDIEAVQQGRQVKIVIRDNGIGIDPEIKDRIWDMFFIGSEHSHGNGLGLYIVRKSVEALKGSIEIVSERGHYTQVTVQIPVMDTLTISPRKEQSLLATQEQ